MLSVRVSSLASYLLVLPCERVSCRGRTTSQGCMVLFRSNGNLIQYPSKINQIFVEWPTFLHIVGISEGLEETYTDKDSCRKQPMGFVIILASLVTLQK